MSTILTVRISHNNWGGYDWYERTEQELYNNYCIYQGCLYNITSIKKFFKCWKNEGTIEATPAEIYNHKLYSNEDKTTVEYCRQAFNEKYPATTQYTPLTLK